MNLLNIIVGTPGRVLQHMEESPLWEASGLRILGKPSVSNCFGLVFFFNQVVVRDCPFFLRLACRVQLRSGASACGESDLSSFRTKGLRGNRLCTESYRGREKMTLERWISRRRTG